MASLDGQLKIDDRILEVNSDDLSILSQEHAANHIQVRIKSTAAAMLCAGRCRCGRYSYYNCGVWTNKKRKNSVGSLSQM